MLYEQLYPLPLNLLTAPARLLTVTSSMVAAQQHSGLCALPHRDHGSFHCHCCHSVVHYVLSVAVAVISDHPACVAPLLPIVPCHYCPHIIVTVALVVAINGHHC